MSKNMEDNCDDRGTVVKSSPGHPEMLDEMNIGFIEAIHITIPPTPGSDTYLCTEVTAFAPQKAIINFSLFLLILIIIC